jgi:hypothetical protein
MTPKEIYDRKRALAQERKLRDEEAAIMRSNHDLDGDILFAGAVVALERIADALQKIAEKP